VTEALSTQRSGDVARQLTICNMSCQWVLLRCAHGTMKQWLKGSLDAWQHFHAMVFSTDSTTVKHGDKRLRKLGFG